MTRAQLRTRDPDTFLCGHPKEPRNRIPTGPRGYSTCALCARARKIVARVVRDQDRINQGKYVRSAAL
jgi:hypothetical protein